MSNGNGKVKTLAIAALLAAIICIATTSFHIPVGVNGGYVHVGDAFIYMAKHFKEKNLPVPEVFIVSDDRIAYLQENYRFLHLRTFPSKL